MCAILIPALIGVGALAVLGGGGAGGCNPCDTSAGVTIPQQNGVYTHGMDVQQAPQQQYYYEQTAYAPQQYAQQNYAGQPVAQQYQQPMAYASQPQYSSMQQPSYGTAATAPMVSAGGYANPNGVSASANVGDTGAGMGLGYPSVSY